MARPFLLLQLCNLAAWQAAFLYGSSGQAVTGQTVECRTGAQLTAAVANADVQTAVLPWDTSVTAADWAPYPKPVLLERNLTILGAHEDVQDWVMLDLGYVKAKVQLGPGVVLNFSRIVLVRSRGVPPFQPLGLDILVSTSGSANATGTFTDVGPRPGIALAWSAALLWRTCLPAASYETSITTWPRPAAIPGNQSALGSVPPPVPCVNDTSGSSAVPLMRRCWAGMGMNLDVGINGLDTDVFGKTLPTGYLIWSINMYFVCLSLMSEACVAEFGPAACYRRDALALVEQEGLLIAARLQSPGLAPPPLQQQGPPPPPAPASPGHGGSGSGGSGRGSGHLLAPLLGGVLGGGLAALVLAAVLLVVRTRRRRQRRGPAKAAAAAQTGMPSQEAASPHGGATAPPEVMLAAGGAACHGGTADGAGANAQDEEERRLAVAAQHHRSGGSADPRVSPVPCASAAALIAGVPQDRRSGPGHAAQDDQGNAVRAQGSHRKLSPSRLDLELLPVTALTPLAADIDLQVQVAPAAPQADAAAGSADGKAKVVVDGDSGSGSSGDADDAGGGGVELLPTLLGKGGYGRVVLGRYRGRPVAVKLLSTGLLAEVPGEAAAIMVAAAAAAAVAAPVPAASAAAVDQAANAAAVAAAAVAAGVPAAGGAALDEAVNAAAVAAAGGQDAGKTAGVMASSTSGAAGTVAELGSAVCGGGEGAAPRAVPASMGLVTRHGTEPQHDDAGLLTELVDGIAQRSDGAGLVTELLGLGNAGAELLGASATPPLASNGGAGGGAAAAAKPPAQAPSPTSVGGAEVAGGGGGKVRPPPGLATLEQEVEVLARCRHPNVVRLLAANLTPPRVCLVMELMDTSLDKLLHGRPGWAQEEQGAQGREGTVGEPGLMPLPKVLGIATQIARALSYLHPTIMHRDLKPANVLVSRPDSDAPVVKIADFGLSRLRNTVLVTSHPEVGTVPYMAPEVFDTFNIRITDRVDIYAFGVIVWEMLTGRRPWQGMDLMQVAYAVVVQGSRLPLEGLSVDRCPPKLYELLHACWDAVPDRRPAAAEIVKTLALVQQALSLPNSGAGNSDERFQQSWRGQPSGFQGARALAQFND